MVNGDAPLLSEALVRDFLAEAGGADLAFATILPDNPGAYGRVVRKQGRVLGIVEAKDYDPARPRPGKRRSQRGHVLAQPGRRGDAAAAPEQRQ